MLKQDLSQSQFKALKGKKENSRQTQGVVYFDHHLDAANSKFLRLKIQWQTLRQDLLRSQFKAIRFVGKNVILPNEHNENNSPTPRKLTFCLDWNFFEQL